MKNLLLIAPLLLFSCASTPEMVPLRPAVVRTIDRVLDRHDVYVVDDEDLSQSQEDDALLESATMRAVLVLDEASGSFLLEMSAPVLDRHDEYVESDGTLDDLDRPVFLMDTKRLRSLFNSVPSAVESN